MRSRCIFFFAMLAGTVLVSGRDSASGNANLSLEAVRAQLVAHVGDERFRAAQWGIKIASLESGSVLFETNAEKLLKPASNAKLYTAALALDVLGPEFKIRTSFFATTLPENGVLPGDLIVYGRGDPSFSTAFESTNIFDRIVQALRTAGIHRVQGDLVGDSTFFFGPPYGSGWTWDDLQYYYGAEISALCAYDNVIDLTIRPGEAAGNPCVILAKPSLPFLELVNRTTTTNPKTRPSIEIYRPPGREKAYINGSLPKGYGTWTDAVSVYNAPLWFVMLLKDELVSAGISVEGRARVVSWPENSPSDMTNLKEIASVTSPDIGTIVHKMMKASQNLYAQLLLLQVGSTANEADRQKNATEALGLKRLAEFAQRAGIRPNEVLLDDGAGLSRSGLVTPEATVRLLRYMAKHQAADLFRASLPEAGTDGTLRTRLKELKGKLQAKTGTIRYVNTLSGYMITAAGEELVFSIMLNAYSAPGGMNNRDDVDAIPRLVARLGERVSTLH